MKNQALMTDISKSENEVVIKLNVANTVNDKEKNISKCELFLQISSKYLEALRNLSIVIVFLTAATLIKDMTALHFRVIYFTFLFVAVLSSVVNVVKFCFEIKQYNVIYNENMKSIINFIMLILAVFLLFITCLIFLNEGLKVILELISERDFYKIK
jgi:hypothetical protein